MPKLAKGDSGLSQIGSPTKRGVLLRILQGNVKLLPKDRIKHNNTKICERVNSKHITQSGETTRFPLVCTSAEVIVTSQESWVTSLRRGNVQSPEPTAPEAVMWNPCPVTNGEMRQFLTRLLEHVGSQEAELFPPRELAAFRCRPEPAFLAWTPVGGEGEAWCQELFCSTWQIVYTSLYEKNALSCANSFFAL